MIVATQMGWASPNGFTGGGLSMAGGRLTLKWLDNDGIIGALVEENDE